ncbi:MAG: alcohol dehydrogenase catalytic domain-containing protein [Planctomycetota bacterium]
MAALTFDGQSLGIATSRETPPLPPGEARIRLRLAGICQTDLEISRGYLQFKGVLGHEFVGDVVACSSPSLQGARVVGEINCACQSCSFCNRGLYSHCSKRTVLGIHGRDGAFQDTFLLPERNLHRVPDTIPDEHAVFTEPLAAACRIPEQVEISPWLRVAVLGDGRLGLLCALVLAQKCHSVTLFGHHPGRIPLPIAVQEQPVPEQPLDPDSRFDLVVEATGSPAGLEQAIGLVAPLGTLMLKTTSGAPHAAQLAPLVIDEIKVVGSRCGPFHTALELMESGSLPLVSMIADRFPLEEGLKGMKRAAEPGVLKVLLEGPSR